ncbi:MAG: tetratricopeptide repeat protein [Bacteroidota bacterium]
MAEPRDLDAPEALATMTVQWATHAPKGLARITYTNAFARDALMAQIRAGAQANGLTVTDVILRRFDTTLEAARTLVRGLEAAPEGLALVWGLEQYVTDDDERSTLLTHLNFLREELARPGLRQVWFVTKRLADEMVRTIPDLDSWFILRLHLREAPNPADTSQSIIQDATTPPPADPRRVDEARRSAAELTSRYDKVMTDAWMQAVQEFVFPAMEQLIEAGAIADAAELERASRRSPDTPLATSWLDHVEVWDEHVAEQANAWPKWYYELGRYAEGLDVATRIDRRNSDSLGPLQPQKLTSQHWRANLLYAQSRYHEAEPLLRDILQLRQQTLGIDHPQTLLSQSNLANLLLETGRYDEAKPFLRDTLQLRQQTLGIDHPDTLLSQNSLAVLFHNTGRYDEAELLYRDTLQLRQQTLGIDHPDTLLSQSNLALLLCGKGICRESLKLLEQAAERADVVLGRDHPDTNRYWSNLSLVRQMCAERA